MSRISQFTRILTPSFRESLLDFWFQRQKLGSNSALPGQSDIARWFSRDAEFDKLCTRQFLPALEAIREANVTATELRTALNLKSPLDWLSTLLLLDQMSRNCYRDLQSAVVFTQFDPLASELALQAIKQGVPDSRPIKYQLAYRVWFYLPLMHTENLETHKIARLQYDKISNDAEELIRSGKDSSMDPETEDCYRVFSEQPDMVREYIKRCTDEEEKHSALIERFGRYPHRNTPLGRTSTEDEIAYLKNGGETFGAKADYDN
ncbi:DUF924-domain-containing protein [Aspergillus steynii IBT 23096]|uniref:DUF924-domain-containing protein n=1 Tax=Aspergillus steynii IBT 23096 TaxID=1392250 RepID=A0A2I2G2Z3_9EURO|nr:DUF924-domain-containing protein [Aspergillus steynii IBT 23096]PLB47242.1 DUF924-domain-containing protein [Aspergillus steynii IBT 23096]